MGIELPAEYEPILKAIIALVVIISGLVAFAKAHESTARARRAAEDQARQQRWHALAARFGQEAATAVMAGRIWQGQTAEMVIEALGRPVDVDERVLNAQMSQVWKYRPLGHNRYGLRVFIDNGVVVGWESK